MKSDCREGFSAVELIIVILLIGILFAVAVPKFRSSISRYRGQLAAKRLVADLEYAGSFARATSGPVTMHFATDLDSGESRYWFDRVPDPHHSGQTLGVELATYQTEFESMPSDITFNLYGYPSADAQWLLVGPSGDRFDIRIDKSTGKVRIE